jgi:hypothetical protein
MTTGTMRPQSMGERYCALFLGVLFLIVGIAGFVPALISLPGTAAANIPADVADPYAAGYGYVFGLFPTNLVHNLVHLIVGLLGIASYSTLRASRLYNRCFAIAYALIATMGFLPVAQTTFGLMPIFGNNVWLNASTAVAAAYFGFVIPSQAESQIS